MMKTVPIVFTVDEVRELAIFLDEHLDIDGAFVRNGAVPDAAFTTGLLKLLRARVMSGDVKGIDLHLPPWASQVVLARLAPLPPASKVPARTRAPKRRARPSRRRPAGLPARTADTVNDTT